MITLEEVYCKFGEVSEAAQLLETELGNILLITEAGRQGYLNASNPEKSLELLNKIDRQTLGQRLKALSSSVEDVSYLSELFSDALNERNRLAHSFYLQHNFRRNSEEGCEVMLSDLEAMHETILKAYASALLLSGADVEMKTLPTDHLPIGPYK